MVVPRRALVWSLLLPVLLVAAYLRITLGRAEAEARPAETERAVDRTALDRQCQFPGQGSERQRLVIAIVDSLRAETALDPRIMPWLSAHRARALSGPMTPCLSQLSLLCFRTMFEGSEPLLVTGFNNYTGMSVAAPSLIHRLGKRGVRVAAVADQSFIRLYQSSLTKHVTFEERGPKFPDRDAFGRKVTFEWLADPTLDVVISHVIDTDATAHRVGVGHPVYVAKFHETDEFLREVSTHLGERDSLIVLGDHGHDSHGYHSTGIASITEYFASGPAFAAGAQRELTMPSLYFLAGAVTCEPTPALYLGEQPFDQLRLPGATLDALRRLSPAPVRRNLAATSIGLDAVSLALGILLLLCLSATVRGQAHVPPLGWSAAALALAIALAQPLLLAISTLVTLGAVLRRRLAERRTLVLVLLVVLWNLVFGWCAPWLLVTLQNQVNPQWTIGFMTVLVLIIVLCAPFAQRFLAAPRALAFGLTAWSLVLFGLFLGPYYYASLRNLLLGTDILIVGCALFVWRQARDKAVLSWLLLIVPATLPVLFPVLKEWQPRWVMIDFAQKLGVLGTAACVLAYSGLAAWLSPLRAGVKRTFVCVLALFVTGALTELSPPVLLATALLTWSWFGFWNLSAALKGKLPGAELLVPVGQASYVLALYFVMLGSLRFANVDFRFALAVTPIDKGEAAAALAALPFVLLKYFLPLALLLLSGPRLQPLALCFILLKVLAAGAALLGMQLALGDRLGLFKQLQAQELALLALCYVVLALGYVAASLWQKSAPAPDVSPAASGAGT